MYTGCSERQSRRGRFSEVTAWWWAQAAANPVSPSKFPGSRELAGNFPDSGSERAFWTPINKDDQLLTSKFPTHRSREFFDAQQGISYAEQGHLEARRSAHSETKQLSVHRQAHAQGSSKSLTCSAERTGVRSRTERCYPSGRRALRTPLPRGEWRGRGGAAGRCHHQRRASCRSRPPRSLTTPSSSSCLRPRRARTASPSCPRV